MTWIDILLTAGSLLGGMILFGLMDEVKSKKIKTVMNIGAIIMFQILPIYFIFS